MNDFKPMQNKICLSPLSLPPSLLPHDSTEPYPWLGTLKWVLLTVKAWVLLFSVLLRSAGIHSAPSPYTPTHLHACFRFDWQLSSQPLGITLHFCSLIKPSEPIFPHWQWRILVIPWFLTSNRNLSAFLIKQLTSASAITCLLYTATRVMYPYPLWSYNNAAQR